MVSTRFSKSAMLLAACLMLVACGEDSDVRLGREALEAGDPDKALNFFSIAAERNRTDANVRALIGQVHLRKGNLREAAAWFRQAQQLGYSGATLAKLLNDEANSVATRDSQRALALYAMAVEFDSSVAKQIAQVIVSAADQMLAGTPFPALQLYEAAVKYDRSVASPTAKRISEVAASKLGPDPNTALTLYRAAVKYDGSIAAAASERISQVAVSQLDSDMNTALRMMVVAVEYNSALKKSLADLLTKSAIQALGVDNFDRIEALTMHAISYDPNVSTVIANGAFERAKALGSDPKDWGRIIRFARFARPLKGTDALIWGNLLYGLVTQAGKAPVNSNDVIGMGRIVVDLDGTKRAPLAKLLVQLGTKEVEQDSLDLNAAVELYNVAIGFDASTKVSVSNAVWENFSHRLFAQPPKLTKDQFGQYLQTAGNFGVPPQYANTVAPYAQALRQYLDGNRTQAISTFSQIAQGRPTTREGKAAASMLAPPPPNTIKFNAQPFHFNTWSYGVGGGRGVDIQLVSADVAQDGINITFSIKSPADHPDLLLFARKNHDGGIMGGTCELLYLLDDNGAKFYSISGGFQGGRQTNFNECAQAINFNAGEEVFVTARFPMISRGATTVKVVSPDPDRAGHQSEWWVANLQLKRGPFDAPPPPPKLTEPANIRPDSAQIGPIKTKWHLSIQPLNKPLTDWADVIARVSKVPGVRFAAPVLDSEAIVSSSQNTGIEILVKGIRPQDLQYQLTSVLGGNFKTLDSVRVALGKQLAKNLAIRVGDDVTLRPKPGAVYPQPGPSTKTYKVAAILDMPIIDDDATVVFMDLAAAAGYFTRTNGINRIEVFVANPGQVKELRDAITAAAQRPIFLFDWQQRDGVAVTQNAPDKIAPAGLSTRGVSLAVQDPALHVVANTTPPDAFVALRTLPSSRTGERITTMPNGTALQVLQRRPDGWWHVQIVETGQKGWALSGQSGKVWITER